MRMLFAIGLLTSACLLVSGPARAQENKKIPGIGPAGEVVKVQSGFKFTEGPAADAEGNVYFSDVRGNLILKVDASGQLSTFLEDSRACNGLMFDGKGRLIACQGGAGRMIAIDPKSKSIQPIAAEYQGKPFNAPNDLVVDRQGGVYFTDPAFGKQTSQDKMGVYYQPFQHEPFIRIMGVRNGLHSFFPEGQGCFFHRNAASPSRWTNCWRKPCFRKSPSRLFSIARRCLWG